MSHFSASSLSHEAALLGQPAALAIIVSANMALRSRIGQMATGGYSLEQKNFLVGECGVRDPVAGLMSRGSRCGGSWVSALRGLALALT